MASDPIRFNEPAKFGDGFELDVSAYELRRAGRPLKLERIPMELLVLLVELRGQLVTRDQIVERIWGKEVFLDTDNSINGAIRKIRQVLKDDPERPRFVLTVTGKGYRFVAPVEEIASPIPISATPPRAEEGQPGAAETLLGKKVSHYRVLQMLGGGGMGLVYKAEDLKLGRFVALKFLPSELASDPKAFERFEREARAASALDHPNICSIYHLGEYEGQPFIVMPLLEGQTLRDWIEKAPAQNAHARIKSLIELAIQVAEGLEAAHQRGIIHRDIKPANIFVTLRGQAKILDFGVAMFMDAAGPGETKELVAPPIDGGAAKDPRLTLTGASVGTPSYLSPEQVRREKLDARTDLFSFGLVLYEMATGQRAFSGNTATAIREAVLNLPVVPARQLNPEIPAALEKVVGRCLEKDPDRRYPTARELQSDLVALRRPMQSALWRRPKVAWIAAALVVVGGLVLANVGGVRSRVFRRGNASNSLGQVKARPSVAVLGFKNLSGREDENWISTALSEMLGAELHAGRQLRIVPGENVTRMKLDLSLQPAESYGQDTLAKMRNHLNADMVVLGSYLAMGKGSDGKVRVDLQLQDTRSGETIAVISQDGTEAGLADLVSRSGTRLRQALGANGVSAAEAGQLWASVPTNLEAARLYSEGLAELGKYDALAARDLLEKAVAADPKHALSHFALSRAWAGLGYSAKAADQAKQALDLSANLPREQRLAIEGNYRELTHDLPGAIEIYRTLRNFFPDNLDYALRLASLQTSSDLGKDALQTVARMRALPAPAGEDPRIDLVACSAYNSLGDFTQGQKAAASAVVKAKAQSSRAAEAEATTWEAWMWDRLGNLDRAQRELTETRDLAAASGNPLVMTRHLRTLGIVLYDKGDFAGATKFFEETVTILRKIGARFQLSHALISMGNVLYEQGRLEEARRYYEEALLSDREIGASPGAIGSDIGSIANVMDGLGDLVGATRMQEESLRAFRKAGDKRGQSTTLGNLGNVLVERGELAQAKQYYDKAIALEQEIGFKSDRASSILSLADVYLAQDQLEMARDRAQQAVALCQELGDPVSVAVGQFELAVVAFEQGRMSESESLVRSAAPKLDEQNKSVVGSQTAALLVKILLAQSKVAEAKAAASHAVALSQKTSDRNARFAVAIASALVDAAEGRTAEAMRGLESVRADAGRYGYAWVDFEARLRLGELELRFGRRASGRARLQQLETEARNKDFLLIARKAENALRGLPNPK